VIATLLFNDHSITQAMGRQAGIIEHEWWLFFWITAVVFVLTMLALARALTKRTDRPLDEPSRATHGAQYASHETRSLTIAVGSAVGVTVIILFIFLFVSISTSRSIRRFESKNALTIQVMGHQWWWHIKYQDPVASQNFQTANEIHIPVGEPVVILTSSNDVIHSFWAPNISGKRDLIPGYSTALWIQADKPGRYRGQCAEFCGHQHAHMAFYIIAEEKSDFGAWKQAQLQPAPLPTPDSFADRGMQKFMGAPCVMCHTIRGTLAGGAVGPDLTHIASRTSIAAGTLPFDHVNLMQWVRNAQAVKPGAKMPAMEMSDEDLNAIVAYLETLK
jgi:cytochrome c oxidase subunit II